MGSAEMSIDAWEGNTNTPVCGVWDGLLTGGLQPLVTLPHVIRAAIRLTNAQVVLLTEVPSPSLTGLIPIKPLHKVAHLAQLIVMRDNKTENSLIFIILFLNNY